MLRLVQALGVPGELQDILGFFTVDFAQDVEEQLVVVRMQARRRNAATLRAGLFSIAPDRSPACVSPLLRVAAFLRDG